MGGFYGKGIFWGENSGKWIQAFNCTRWFILCCFIIGSSTFLDFFFLETIFLFSLFRKNEWFTLYNILFLFSGILTKSDDNDANTNKGACLEMTRIKQKKMVVKCEKVDRAWKGHFHTKHYDFPDEKLSFLIKKWLGQIK